MKNYLSLVKKGIFSKSIYCHSERTTCTIRWVMVGFLCFAFGTSKLFAQANVTISTGSTANGGWSSLGGVTSGYYTFTPSANNAVVNLTELTNRLNGTGVTQGSVEIVTTCSSCGGSGNVTISNNISTTNPSSTQFTFKITASGSITIGNNITTSLTGAATTATRPGYNIVYSAGTGISGTGSSTITTSGGAASSAVANGASGAVTMTTSTGNISLTAAITTTGSANSSGAGGVAGSGGAVSLTSTAGSVSGTAITASGGAGNGGSGANGGSGGAISISAATGITFTGTIASSGGAAVNTFTPGAAGNITLTNSTSGTVTLSALTSTGGNNTNGAASTNNTNPGGAVSVTNSGGNISFTSSPTINVGGGSATSSAKGGNAGSITLNAPSGNISGTPVLTAVGGTNNNNTGGGGTGGNIIINSTTGGSIAIGNITTTGGSVAGVSAGCNAGSVTIKSTIASSTVSIAAISSNGSSSGASGASAGNNGGAGGTIDINVSGSESTLSITSISNTGGAGSGSSGGGAGGSVTIASPGTITFTGSIASNGGNSGSSGASTNTGGNGAAISITSSAGAVTGITTIASNGGTASSTALAGSGGNVSISAASGNIGISSTINTFGAANGNSGSGNNGGNLTLTATSGNVSVTGAVSCIGGNSNGSGTSGKGGAVTVNASGTVTFSSTINTSGGGNGSSGTGNDGGNVNINNTAPSSGAVSVGAITTSGGTMSFGQAGRSAGTVSITSTSSTVTTAAITAQGTSNGGTSGAGGSVTISGNGNVTIGGAISTTSANAGGTNAGSAGGAVSITSTTGLVSLAANNITTTGGNGSGGNSNGGSGGAITISGNTVSSSGTPTYTTTAGNRVGTGTSVGGNVSITGTSGITLTAGVTSAGQTSNGTLTINDGNATATSGGANDGNTAGVYANLSLTKSGTGIYNIGAASTHTYTGTTTVSAGTLQLAAANKISSSSPFTFTGGTLRTGATTGFTQTFANLFLNGTATIALGTGAHTLTFNGKTGTWSGSLVITGWTGASGYGSSTTGSAGKVIVGSNGTLSAGELAMINFFDGTDNWSAKYATGTGELIPNAILATPSVALSSSNPAVAAASIATGTTNNQVYNFSLAVTSANTTVSQISFTTTGTATSSDITNFKLWYSTSATFASASQIGSNITSSTGAGTRSFTGLSQSIANGVTGNFWITADIASGATGGNTLAVSALTTSDITLTLGTKSGTASAGETQTIATPALALSSSNPAVAAASIATASTNNQVYNFSLAVTTASTTVTQVDFTTTGTATSSDITNFKLWYSTSATFGSASQIGSSITSNTGAGSRSFTSLTQAISVGTTGNFWITADIASSATPANTLVVSAITTSNITASGTKSGSASAGGTQTIVGPTVVLSSPGQVSAGNVGQNTTKNALSAFQLAVTVANATLNSVTFTTTNTAADITKYQLWYNSSNNLSTASQIGSDITTSLGSGSRSFSGLTQVINSGATGFFWITADITTGATPSNTIVVSAMTSSDFTIAVGTKSGSATAGGTQTIIATAPVITLSSPSQIGAGNLSKGSSKNALSAFQIALSSANNATLTQVDFTTTGTATGTDLTTFKLWFNSSSATLSSAVQIGSSVTAGSAGSYSFTGLSQSITFSTTGYFWITVDVPSGATTSNTVAVSSMTTSNLTFASGSKSGSITAGGTQTIIATPTYYAIASGNWGTNTTWSLSAGGSAVSSGVFPGATDNVVITGFTVTLDASRTCNDITLTNGTSIVNPAGGYGLTVNGNVSGAGSFGGNLNFGSFTFAGTDKTFSGSTAVQVNQASTITISGVYTVNSGASFTINGASGGWAVGVNINDNFTNNGTFTVGSAAITGVTLTIAAGKTLTNGTNASLNLNCNTFAGTGTLVATASPNTVTFGSTAGAQQIYGTTYHHLIVNKSGQTGTLAANATINGDLTISAGTLADGGFTATVKGNVTNNGTHSGAGKIYLNGGSQEHVVTTTSSTGNNSFAKLELDDAQGAVIQSAGSVAARTTTIATLTHTAGQLRIGDFDNGSDKNLLVITNAYTVPNGGTFRIDGNATATNAIRFNGSPVTISATGTWTGTAGKSANISFANAVSLTNSNTTTAQVDNSNSIYTTLDAGTFNAAASPGGLSVYRLTTTTANGTYSGNWTIRNLLTVGGNFALNANAIMTISNPGTFSVTSGTFANCSSSSQLLLNTGQTIPSGMNFGCQVSFGGTAQTYTSAGTQNFKTSVTIKNGCTFDDGGFAWDLQGGTPRLTMEANSIFKIGTSTTAIVSGFTDNTQSLDATSTMDFYGNYAYTYTNVNFASFPSLKLSGTSTSLSYNGGSNTGIAGNLTIGSGCTLRFGGAGTYTLKGNLINNGTFNASNNAANRLILSGGSAVHQISGSSSTYTPNSTNVILQLNDAQGAQLNSGVTASIPTLLLTSGTFTNNGTLTVGTSLTGAGTFVNAANASFTYGGTGDIAPTLTASASPNTVIYTNTANVKNPSSSTYHHLTMNGAAKTGTITANTTVNGDLSITSGTLADGGFAVSVKGNVTNGGVHSSTGSGKISLSNTSSAQTISGAGTFGQLEIANTSATGVVQASDLGISSSGNKYLNVTSGAKFTINSGVTVTNGGTLSNVGTLVNNGTISTTGTASNTGTFTNSGTFTNTGLFTNTGSGAVFTNSTTVTANFNGGLSNLSSALFENPCGATANVTGGAFTNSGTITGGTNNYTYGRFNNTVAAATVTNTGGTIGSSTYLSFAGTISGGTVGASPLVLQSSSQAATCAYYTLSATSLSDYSYCQGSGPSTSKSFTISGNNLTGSGSVTINASTNFEVSSDNSTFGATATYPFASGIITSQPKTVYVRLKAGLTSQTSSPQTYGSENVTVASSGNAVAQTVSNIGQVDPIQTVSVGSALSAICQGATTVALGGSFGGSATSAVWDDGDAGGSFSNNTGNTPATATYTAASNSASPVTLTLTTSGSYCSSVNSNKSLTVNPNPTVGAGSALSAVCQGATTAALGGSFGGGATSAVWDDGGAGGSFSNNTGSTPATATYTAASNSASPVTLTLTTSGGSCGTTSANKSLTVNPNPTVSAGSALSAVCQGATTAALGGSFGGGATSAVWSDGGAGGSFGNNTGSTPATATYTAASNSGSPVTLTLTTSGGSCGTTSANKSLTVNPNPTVSAGSALSAVCQGATTAALGGSFGGGATSAVWSDGGAGGSFGNNTGSTPATATYTAASNSASPVTLTLTTSGGSCGTTSDTKSLTVNAKQSPSLLLTSDAAGSVNSGTNVTFTASPSNTGGGTLSYTFKKGATILQAASSSNTYLAVAGSGTFPVGSSSTVFAELSITGGCVTSSAATSNNVSLVVNSTTAIVWNGSAWSNGTGPTAFDDVIMLGTYNGPAFTAKNVTVNSSTTLTIASGSVITVTGVLTNNGTITVSDGAGIVQGASSTLAGSGSYKVQKIGSTTAYSYWSTPVVSAPVFGTNCYFYNEAVRTAGNYQTGWKPATGTLQLGLGYSGFRLGSRTFNGVINNGDVNRGVSYTNIDNNPATDGWNLLGNPYPSTVSVGSFLSANSARIDQAVYYWNGSNYVTENSGNIPVCQGFFVHAQSTGTVSFKNNMRNAGTNPLYRMSDTPPVIKLRMGIGSNTDVTQIELREGASDGYDLGIDAFKLKGNDVLQLYSRIVGNLSPFAINVLSAGNDKKVQLAYDAKSVGTFTVSISENNSGLPIYLKDNELGILHDLSTPYSYQGGGVNGSERFMLYIAPSTTSLESNKVEVKQVTIWTRDKDVVVDGSGMLEVKIMDIGGRTVATGMGDGRCLIAMGNAPAGLYVVVVNGIFVQKVVLR